MREFFRGWKRKFGMVTLGLACVLAATWIRSEHYSDHVDVCWNRQDLDHLVSSHRGLAWAWVRNMRVLHADAPDETPWVDFGSISCGDSFQPDYMRYTEIQREWCGFRLGQIGPSEGGATGVYEIPHWSIIIPLALISTYLLLVKPRPAKKPATSLPTDPDHA